MEFFCIMTLSEPIADGLHTATITATLQAPAGATRQELFDHFLTMARNKANMPMGTVIFFDAALNELPVPASSAAC